MTVPDEALKYAMKRRPGGLFEILQTELMLRIGKMAQDTEEPLTPLQESAAQMYELFESWVEAGWSRWEALYLIRGMLTSNVTPPDED